MPVQLLDSDHSTRRDLVEADEDPVFEKNINGDGDDAHKQDNVLLLNFNAVVTQEQVKEASPTWGARGRKTNAVMNWCCHEPA